MSYITIQNENGEMIECSSVKIFEDQKNAYRFSQELEKMILQNNEAGREPFSGIDFPQGQISREFESVNLAAIRQSEVFRSAMEKQLDKHINSDKTKEFFNFVNNVVSVGNTKYTNEDRLAGRAKGRDDTILKTIYDVFDRHYFSEKFVENVPLTTAVLLDDYALRTKGELKHDNSVLMNMSEEKANGEIQANVAQAMMRVVEERGRHWYFRETVKLMPAFINSDLRQLDERQKNKLFEVVSRCGDKYKEEYISKAKVGNLTGEMFLSKENITKEDLSEFAKVYRQYNGSFSQYLFLTRAKPENESAANIRGALSLDIVINGDDAEKSKISDNDLLNGIRQNPEKVKALGAKIPKRILDVITQDSDLQQNPDFKFLAFSNENNKFVIGSKLSDKDSIPNGISEVKTVLQEISKQGFNSGYGVELVLGKVKGLLDKYEELDVDGVYNRMQEHIEAKKVYDKVSLENEELRSWGMGPGLDEAKCQKYGLSNAEIFKMARDKALGKDVAPLKYEIKETKGISRLFMSKQQKQQEEANNKAGVEFFESVESYMKDFLRRTENKQSKEILEKYSSLDEIRTVCDKQRAYLDDNYEFKYDKWTEKGIENVAKAKDTYHELGGLYKEAKQTLERQISIQRQAHTTSGIKDIEQNTGFDAMTVKSEIRKENPNFTVQELYAEINRIRAEGKYNSEINVKETSIVAEAVENTAIKEKIKFVYPKDLSSKNEQIQKAIDLVRNGKYENVDALFADKENFGVLPKYAQQAAHQIYASVNNSTSWSSQAKIDNFCKLAVRNAEKAAKEQANKMRGLGKDPVKKVVKREVSKDMVRQAVQGGRQ